MWKEMLMRAQLNTHSWEEVLHARGSTSGRQQPHARAVTPPEGLQPADDRHRSKAVAVNCSP